MVEIYCKLIIGKRRDFASIPENFKDAVETRLKELGYDIKGEPINRL